METRIFGDGKQQVYNFSQVSEGVGPDEQPAKVRSRRSALEINMDILKAVRDGALGPTQIMYRANLTWVILTTHLRELVKYEIVSERKVKARLTYILTERGINLLQSYLVVVEQFEQFELGRESPNRVQQSPSLVTR